MRSARSPRATIASVLSRSCALGARLRTAGGEFLRGCAGLDDYARYLAHQQRHHAEQVPLGREAFFRRELSARWDGVRRCC